MGEEHQRADALGAVGEAAVPDNEMEQMRRLFLAALAERLAEHGLSRAAALRYYQAYPTSHGPTVHFLSTVAIS